MKYYPIKIIIIVVLSVFLIFSCRKKNKPPYTPYTPSGPGWSFIYTSQEFTSLAIDPDEDSVAIRFDWGDGLISDWTSFVPSGQTIVTNHYWNDSGFFYVKAQAKDIKENTSNWSLPISILIKDTALGWICATDLAPWGPREGHTTVMFDNKMWVIGGSISLPSAIEINDVWFWDVSIGK